MWPYFFEARKYGYSPLFQHRKGLREGPCQPDEKSKNKYNKN